ncbi:hypothetical protein Pmani_032310 [Petrolisthes manimaculis]|uniref:Uncharacterized protein n=1 Tax=Petrolisthes manimaculis TaxID=1843537 RepID=A0AAE1NS18_9EUCA|nr:hypothetical protein Pmani_032310 [Petrolisthes manimaculis]
MLEGHEEEGWMQVVEWLVERLEVVEGMVERLEVVEGMVERIEVVEGMVERMEVEEGRVERIEEVMEYGLEKVVVMGTEVLHGGTETERHRTNEKKKDKY